MPKGVYEHKIIPAEVRFWKYVDKHGENGCWLWTGLSKTGAGYGIITNEGRHIAAHRLSFAINNEYGITLEDMEGTDILHECDNPACVNPAHLFLGTHQDNMDDKTIKGRNNPPKGEEHFRSKLTEIQVKEIRERYANGGTSHKKLGDEYGITKQGISEILHFKCWKHI